MFRNIYRMEEFSLAKVADFRISDFPERLAEAQNYVKQYFVPLNTGNHAVYVNRKFEVMEQSVVKSTYFNRMPDELSKWYFKKYLDLRSITYELNKPLTFGNKLNLCPPMKHSFSLGLCPSETPTTSGIVGLQAYESFDNSIKQKVDIMMNYVFEILANKNQEQYEYILNWISNMLKGNKNNSCLYLRGPQGIGKSTLFCFIRDYVIGKDLCLETGSSPIKSNFNGILAGKLLVVLEELETFSTNEWIAISSRLKRYITSNTMTVENKNVNSYDAPNLNNYVILSNNDAIKDDDGRRYFILDLATHRQKDKKFWDAIYKGCFNDEVGKAFYCKMLELTTDGFYPQDMPLTQSKKDAFVKRLEHQEEFIKTKYVLQQKDINCGVQDLYDEYKTFCSTNSYKTLGKVIFGRKLEEIGIKYYKTGGVNKYKIPYQKLKEIADDKHWIHELDDECDCVDDEIEQNDDDLALIYKNQVIEKDNEIKKLKEELEKLKQMLIIQQPEEKKDEQDDVEEVVNKGLNFEELDFILQNI
jgi:hypothetical protein